MRLGSSHHRPRQARRPAWACQRVPCQVRLVQVVEWEAASRLYNASSWVAAGHCLSAVVRPARGHQHFPKALKPFVFPCRSDFVGTAPPVEAASAESSGGFFSWLGGSETKPTVSPGKTLRWQGRQLGCRLLNGLGVGLIWRVLARFAAYC